jgi:hypothetical protein
MSADLPASIRQRLLKLFAPHPKARNFLIVALLVPGLLLACFSTLVLVADPSQSGMSNTDAFLFLLGLFLLPLAAIILALAALREPHHPPRALIWFAASFSIILSGGIVFVLMLLDAKLERAASLVFLLIIVAPVALLFSLPAMYSATRAIPEIRAALISGASDRALAYISARRTLSLAELSVLAGIPFGEVDNVVDELLHSGRLVGTLDAASSWIYTSAYLAEQQRLLLAWVNLRGRIRMDELAGLLQASPAATTDWLYQLVQRGQFGGYVNWRSKTIYAATVQKIGLNSQCPECGGAIAPAPAQRIVCTSCGTEMFGQPHPPIIP